jgi:hypothetical protein
VDTRKENQQKKNVITLNFFQSVKYVNIRFLDPLSIKDEICETAADEM